MIIHDRRNILFRHVDHDVQIRRQFVAKCNNWHTVKLVDVKRTRAVVQFPDAPIRKITTGRFGLEVKLVPEVWTIPLDWLLLPGCIEPDPRQLPLFGEASDG